MRLFHCLFIIVFFQSLSLFAFSEEPRPQDDAEPNYRALLTKAGFTDDEIEQKISNIQPSELFIIQDLLRNWSAVHNRSLNPSITRNPTMLRYMRNTRIIMVMGALGFLGGTLGTTFLCGVPQMLSVIPEAILGQEALSYLFEVGLVSFSASEFFESCLESTHQLPMILTFCGYGFGSFLVYKYGNEVVVEKVTFEGIISNLEQNRGVLTDTTKENLKIIYRKLFPDAPDNQVIDQELETLNV